MPKIGLVSDSHGRAVTTRRAVDLLVQAGARVLLHLGDVGTFEVLDALVACGPEGGDPLEAHVVFGNVDWDTAGLDRYARSLGLIVDHPVGRLSFADRKLVFLHGDDETAMQWALNEKVAYLCHGHSHRPLDERRGPTRIINPGALFRAQRYTVALLDTDADEVRFLAVGDR